jgi:RND family efflux transporter MFP subunit
VSIVNVNDKATLLERLRIDRGDERGADSDGGLFGGSGRRTLFIAAGGLLVLVVIAIGLWQWRQQNPGLLYRGGAPAASQQLASASPSGTVSSSSPASTGPAADAAAAVPGTSVLDASGYIIARRQATVSAKTPGRLRELLIEAGQEVHGGDVVARLDDSNTMASLLLARAQVAQVTATLEAARVAMEDARPIFKRMEQQRSAAVISAQDFDAAKSAYDTAQSAYASQQAAVAAARASLRVAERAEDDMTVRAPFSGVVTDKAAQPGEIVSPMASSGFTRTGICTIVDMASLEAEVDVSESFLNRVHPGQPAAVRLNAYPDWAIPGNVVAIIPTADRSKATVKVRVGFKVRDPRILPEMGARVSFLAEDGRDAHAR